MTIRKMLDWGAGGWKAWVSDLHVGAMTRVVMAKGVSDLRRVKGGDGRTAVSRGSDEGRAEGSDAERR